jgi:ribosomal-protein-alanine N-acetyltransferase
LSLERGKTSETSRLLLRQFRGDDLDVYAEIMGDNEVGKGFPKGTGYTREESKRSLESIMNHWNKHGFGIWAMTDKQTHIVLGRCGLNFIDEISEVEVDFVVAPNYWRRGFATEAAKAALAHGFTALDLERIIALAKPENTASLKVIEKIGMHFVKYAQHWGVTLAYNEISKADYRRMH